MKNTLEISEFRRSTMAYFVITGLYQTRESVRVYESGTWVHAAASFSSVIPRSGIFIVHALPVFESLGKDLNDGHVKIPLLYDAGLYELRMSVAGDWVLADSFERLDVDG